jgi:ABC-2 type transport system permease protein
LSSIGASIVKDLRDTASALAFELRKHVRRRRLVIAVTLALLIPLAFYLVPRALGVAFAASATLFAGSNLGFAGTLILISSTFFGGDAISSELDKRTFLVSYVAPQRRTSVYAGKFLAAFLATALVAALYFGVILAEMQTVYGLGAVPAAFSTSFSLALLYALAALSVAFTFSSLMRSTISSNMLSFFTMFLVLPIVSGVLSLAGVDPWLVPTYYSSLITSVFGGSSGFAGPGGGGGSAFVPDFHVGLAVVTGWSVALIVSSAVVTARRQME